MILRDFGGVRLAHHQRGEGRTFLFQHGLCGDARQTFDAAPDLPGWALHTVEMRGHGGSDALPPYGFARFTDDLIAVAQTLPAPMVIGGISMGAALALTLAVRRPDLVAGLVLIRPAWGIGPAGANLAPNAAVGARIARGATRADFDATPLARDLAQRSPDNLASLRGFFDRAPLPVTAALLTALSVDDPGLTAADLAALRAPTLVAGCAEDVIHPLPLACDLAARIPAAQFLDLPPKGRDRAAHRAALHDGLTRFLTELPR